MKTEDKALWIQVSPSWLSSNLDIGKKNKIVDTCSHNYCSFVFKIAIWDGLGI